MNGTSLSVNDIKDSVNFRSWSWSGVETAVQITLLPEDPCRHRNQVPVFTSGHLIGSICARCDETFTRYTGALPLGAFLEPDKVQWIDPETNLDCLAVRNHMGAWCGYVGITQGHPLFERSYSSCSRPPSDDLNERCDGGWCSHTPEAMLEVHGGITFAEPCAEVEEPQAVCHVPMPGRSDHVWWFGFDCSHAMDVVPSMLGSSLLISGHCYYRTLGYVIGECRDLAEQLRELAAA